MREGLGVIINDCCCPGNRNVIELAQNDRGDRDNSKRIEIQLIEIGVDTGKSTKFAEYEKAQKAGPGK